MLETSTLGTSEWFRIRGDLINEAKHQEGKASTCDCIQEIKALQHCQTRQSEYQQCGEYSVFCLAVLRPSHRHRPCTPPSSALSAHKRIFHAPKSISRAPHSSRGTSHAHTIKTAYPFPPYSRFSGIRRDLELL